MRKKAFRVAFGLLVAFAVVYAALFIRIKVELPPPAPTAAPQTKAIIVGLTTDGRLSVNGAPTEFARLVADVGKVSASDRNTQHVIIDAPETVKYDAFMAVLKELQDAGWTKVGLHHSTPLPTAPS